MKHILLLSTFLLLTLSGCTYKLVSQKAKAGLTGNNGEQIYYLPKALLHIKAVYIKTITTNYNNGVITEDEPTYTVKSIDITPLLVNDKEKAYTIQGDNGKAFFMAENSGIKFNQYGVIQSLQTTLEDKTLQTVENTLKGVASIAAVVGILGDGESDVEKEVAKKIGAANIQLIDAIEKNDEKAIKKAKEKLLSYYELLKQYYDNNKIVNVQSELTYEYTIDPKLTNPMEVKPFTNTTSTIPPIQVTIVPLAKPETPNNKSNPGVPAETSTTTSRNSEPPTNNGLIYTIPETCRITAAVNQGQGDQNLLDKIILLPQFGQLGVLPITSKVFTSRKTTIEFDPATGTLVTIQRESGSSSENLSKSFATTAELLNSSIMTLKYDQRIEVMKKEKELLELKESFVEKPASEAQKLQDNLNMLKLNLEIEKLKKELIELQKTP